VTHVIIVSLFISQEEHHTPKYTDDLQFTHC